MARTKTLNTEQAVHLREALEKILSNYKTQGELARALGVSPQSVSSALHGRGVGLGIVMGVSKLLNISVENLLNGAIPNTPNGPYGRLPQGIELDFRMPEVRRPRMPDSPFGLAMEQAFDSSKHRLRDSKAVRRVLRTMFRREDLEGDLRAAARVLLDAAAQLRHDRVPVSGEALLMVVVGLRIKPLDLEEFLRQ